jgi:YesN/AraC family two-component response regulator
MLKVLYVDDEPINLELFEVSFMDDFKVFISDSANKALEIYKQNHVDVLVTDLKMPGMNGIELIKKIKEIDSDKNCILLTGFYEDNITNDPETKSMIFRYVMKPYKREDLKTVINEAAG